MRPRSINVQFHGKMLYQLPTLPDTLHANGAGAVVYRVAFRTIFHFEMWYLLWLLVSFCYIGKIKNNNPTPPTHPHLCVFFFFANGTLVKRYENRKSKTKIKKNITYNSTTTTTTATTTTTQSSIHVQLTQPTHGATHAQNRAHVRMCVCVCVFILIWCVCVCVCVQCFWRNKAPSRPRHWVSKTFH